MSDVDERFAKELMGVGILAPPDQQHLWEITCRCARTLGLPMGAAGAVAGAEATGVVLPGLGVVPGAVAGALLGMAAGTVSCVMLQESVKNQIRSMVGK